MIQKFFTSLCFPSGDAQSLSTTYPYGISAKKPLPTVPHTAGFDLFYGQNLHALLLIKHNPEISPEDSDGARDQIIIKNGQEVQIFIQIKQEKMPENEIQVAATLPDGFIFSRLHAFLEGEVYVCSGLDLILLTELIEF